MDITNNNLDDNNKIPNLAQAYKTNATKNMKIEVTTVTQTANEILGVDVKNLYYLIITSVSDQKLIINVGKKTHDNVQKMIDHETTTYTTDKPETKEGKLVTRK